MLKDVVISILGAIILSEHPWFISCDVLDRIAIIVGLAVVLLFFLLFLEEKVEKMRRVRKIRHIMKRLSSRKLAE